MFFLVFVLFFLLFFDVCLGFFVDVVGFLGYWGFFFWVVRCGWWVILLLVCFLKKE